MARPFFVVLSRHTLAMFALLVSVTTLSAQKPGKGPAFTEPPKNDANYALLGEFTGPILVGEDEYQPLGLQVRPIGGDQFEAVSYMGGLPGQKKHKPKAVKMIGRRSGEFLVLSGGPWAIFVETDHCLILDREGNKVGRLDRVERSSPTLGAQPPKDSVVLFDGKNVEQFTTARMTKDGLLMEGADLKPMFQDFDLHVEFRLPYMPQAQGQQRANSGLYLQSRYECQVLDSFALDRLINGLGALYQFRKPDINMCLPPLVWQTYDVSFTAPRWAADGSKIRNAHITSWINGVKVQNNVSLPNKTGAGKQEEPLLLPTRLQNHGDPVRFRNIWLVDRGLTPGVKFPVIASKEKPAPKADPVQLDAPKNAAKKPASDESPKQPAEEKKPAQEKPAQEKPAQEKPAPEKPAQPEKSAAEKESAADAKTPEAKAPPTEKAAGDDNQEQGIEL